MRGFTIPGTAFDKPFQTNLDGIGMVNFSQNELREIDLAGAEVIKFSDALVRVLDDEAALRKVANPDTERLDALTEEREDLSAKVARSMFAHTHLVVKHALCLTTEGNVGKPLPGLETVDDLEAAGEGVRARLHQAYLDALQRMGKSA